jgi:pyruvate/2-oxoglutarate dehydrogenase complex dihydrolipoamide acyltransferase (E2) component
MATDVILPKLGFSMTEGTIAEWLVPHGATATEGQPLFILESDKSATEVESPATGILHIEKQPGQSYEVGTVLARIE